MHYGVEHSISMELYRQYKKGKHERDHKLSDPKGITDGIKGKLINRQ